MGRPDRPDMGASPAMTRGEQAVPVPAQQRPGRRRVLPSRPSPKAKLAGSRPAHAEEQAARTPPHSTTLTAGLASAFGLRLTEPVEESTCRSVGRKRHDRVPFLTGSAEPQRAERRRRRRRPRRLPSRIPCPRAVAFPPQSAEGGQGDACRRPQPHGAAASQNSSHQGHPPLIAGPGRVWGNRAAHSPHGRRRHGAKGGPRPHAQWMAAAGG